MKFTLIVMFTINLIGCKAHVTNEDASTKDALSQTSNKTIFGRWFIEDRHGNMTSDGIGIQNDTSKSEGSEIIISSLFDVQGRSENAIKVRNDATLDEIVGIDKSGRQRSFIVRSETKINLLGKGTIEILEYQYDLENPSPSSGSSKNLGQEPYLDVMWKTRRKDFTGGLKQRTLLEVKTDGKLEYSVKHTDPAHPIADRSWIKYIQQTPADLPLQCITEGKGNKAPCVENNYDDKNTDFYADNYRILLRRGP